MATNPQKESLRKVLLEKRDGISFDLLKIASKQIHSNLKKIEEFRKAKKIAFYYPIGSEVLTQDIMQEAKSLGKEVLLPKVEGKHLSFRRIKDWNDLEKGKFDIMEPKEECPKSDEIDVVLVPTVGISHEGYRLGYGHGYYDRFLANTNAVSIAITFSAQVVRSIPFDENDVKVNWVVTEDEFFKAS